MLIPIDLSTDLYLLSQTLLHWIFKACSFHVPDQSTELFATDEESVHILNFNHFSLPSKLMTRSPAQSSANWEDHPLITVFQDHYYL